MTFPRHFARGSSSRSQRGMCVIEGRPGCRMGAGKCVTDWRPRGDDKAATATGQQRITSGLNDERQGRRRRRRRRRGSLPTVGPLALRLAILAVLAVGARTVAASYSDTDDLINELDRPKDPSAHPLQDFRSE
uniref:Uncharacterized protein n=1 Tax=Anopheles atroparvus TaxID=41427 RepID=A0A182JJZ4_ANOAO